MSTSSPTTKEEVDIAVAEKESIKEPSQYNVIVHNNDYTSYDEVIIILCNSFELSHPEALEVANRVHVEGRGKCGTYSKEVAEMKLVLVDTIKNSLIQIMPNRAKEIKILAFSIEKV
jgi:ATP-dependent Clp protease adaptor protein ClpS